MNALRWIALLALVALAITCGETVVEPPKLRIGHLPPPTSSLPLGNIFKHQFELRDADSASEYIWQTIVTNRLPSGQFRIDDTGLFEFISAVADSGMVFSFRILVLNLGEIVLTHDFLIQVERTAPAVIRLVSRSRYVLLEFPFEVSIIKVSGDLRFDGSEFCFAYDSLVLKPELVSIGADVGVNGCNWEYFTYRFLDGRYSSPLRQSSILVAMVADVNNGASHPDCVRVPDGAELARIRFRVKADPALLCSKTPLEFLWFDCEVNSVRVAGAYVDTLHISTTVMSEEWDGSFPLAEQRLQRNDCDSSYQPSLSGFCERFRSDCTDFPTVDRLILWNGAVSFVCPDSIDVYPRVDENRTLAR